MNQNNLDDAARFSFGANWARFLSVLNDDRIAEAVKSLQTTLDVVHLNGMTFLDIGSGSGLFSLAARRPGAKVHSLDYARNRLLARRSSGGGISRTMQIGSKNRGVRWMETT